MMIAKKIVVLIGGSLLSAIV
ncbi:MAG: hypothetical protein ACD_42C00099G0003, partial [uncultured bacterium]